MNSEDVIRKRNRHEKHVNRHFREQRHQRGPRMSGDMDVLLPIEGQQFPDGETIPTVNARMLHAWLEAGRDYSTWIKGRIEKYGFTKNRDFITLPRMGEALGVDFRGAPNAIDYHLSIDMAKELAMVENNARGQQARRYFIECEKRLHALPVVDASSLPTHLETAEALVIALRNNRRLEAENAVLAPKAAVHDAIADASGLLTLQQAGNELGYGRTKLIDKLKAMGILQSNGQPYRRNIDAGRFAVKNKIIRKGDRDVNYPQVFVTGTGLAWLSRLLHVPMQGDLLDGSHGAPLRLN